MEEATTLLLSVALGPCALEDDPQWRDVPAVVRSSFLLLAEELRRLRGLLLANLPPGSSALEGDTQDADDAPSDPRILRLQAETQRLQTQVRDLQRQADARHAQSKQKLSSLWGEVAATAQAAADAQTQQLAAADRVAVSWEAAQKQLEMLQRRVDAQEQHRLELRSSQERCAQQLRRMQREFAAHDHRVVGTALRVQKVAGPETETGKLDGEIRERVRHGPRKQGGAAGRVLLHQRYVEALKRQQQRDRAELSTVVEDRVSV
ncbi:putative secreted RxLR effector protein [Phytophthora cinnamomi]|uniref:putative secreted RxLR effector protein n=1 Tax=Phytophthora cinnamomi TaxID=4785 RepID=UPI003559F1D8|nr:putative secreted RxLR effector protein [Phytophthora cinnamomi]